MFVCLGEFGSLLNRRRDETGHRRALIFFTTPRPWCSHVSRGARRTSPTPGTRGATRGCIQKTAHLATNSIACLVVKADTSIHLYTHAANILGVKRPTLPLIALRM